MMRKAKMKEKTIDVLKYLQSDLSPDALVNELTFGGAENCRDCKSSCT